MKTTEKQAYYHIYQNLAYAFKISIRYAFLARDDLKIFGYWHITTTPQVLKIELTKKLAHYYKN